LQTRLDDNLFNRIEAFRRLTDIQRVKLLTCQTAEIDEVWINLFGELLKDKSIVSSVKAFMLRIDEQPLDRNYSSWHTELVSAREKLMKAINGVYKGELIKAFESLDTYRTGKTPKDGIEDRILKQTLLELIAIDDTPASHEIIRGHYWNAKSATDKIGALVAMNRSSMSERIDTMEKTYRDWVGHITAYANYLRIISSGWNNDLFEMIGREAKRPSFDITNPTWARALFLTMAGNSKKIWTQEGIDWATRVIIELASVNTYVASKLLNVFQDFKRMRPDMKPLVGAALKTVINEATEDVCPTVHRQALSYLE
ncbi:MAG: aminopeptidase N C-terminal domain-containing protein, partial [Desulfomonilaceae bacterium]